jgi:hypothetical protein|tara:strand:+ start:2048 stop:2335 length:288 start_codon:yes stop_codon:yes gene_type:complete
MMSSKAKTNPNTRSQTIIETYEDVMSSILERGDKIPRIILKRYLMLLNKADCRRYDNTIIGIYAKVIQQLLKENKPITAEIVNSLAGRVYEKQMK